MYLSDKDIIQLSQQEKPLISPFISSKESCSLSNRFDGIAKEISHGLSQNGYDIRLGSDVEFFVIDSSKEKHSGLDPLESDEYAPIAVPKLYKTKAVYFKDANGRIERKNVKCWEIYPGEFVLAHSLESFNIPDNLTGLLFCKSSYARLGMNMAPTVLKSGWSGQLVLEIYNQTKFIMTIYEGCGIGTIYFAEHADSSLNPYDGKYQHQEGVVKAR